MLTKNVVIGTAGHIDHGKTTLIKALTGIETDTTVEERQRGVSINLGFAYLDLQDERVGIVDVPGHERFVKNMLAGVTGINLVLLVIDANEGIMPQTKEHMDILTLLGIKNFIVAVTKITTVDEELRELVLEEIKTGLAKTPLVDAPIIETDALAGIGLEELKYEIQKKVAKIEPMLNQSQPRLNVDRTFSVKGHGTIVTGTLLDGSITVGDEVSIYPIGKRTRVRSIQVHETSQHQAFAGQRTALNLSKISLAEIKRGDVLTVKDNVTSTWMIDVKLSILPTTEMGISLWERVRLHIGTNEVLARVVPLGTEILLAGCDGFVQLRLEQQIAVKQGDHFILRSYSPMVTIAGGIVLEANAVKHRRYSQALLESLQVKESGDFAAVLLDCLNKKRTNFVTAKDLADYLNTTIATINDKLGELMQQHQIIKVNHTYISAQKLQEIGARVQELLRDYHQLHPLQQGMPLEEFRSRLALSQREAEAIVVLLKNQEQVETTQTAIRLVGFKVAFTAEQLEVKERIERTLLEAALMPPTLSELLDGEPEAAAVLETLIGDSVYYLNQETLVHMSVYQQAVKQVKEYLQKNETMTLGEFRDMLQTSRKYAKVFLEHLDDLHITKRMDDSRVLVN